MGVGHGDGRPMVRFYRPHRRFFLADVTRSVLLFVKTHLDVSLFLPCSFHLRLSRGLAFHSCMFALCCRSMSGVYDSQCVCRRKQWVEAQAPIACPKGSAPPKNRSRSVIRPFQSRSGVLCNDLSYHTFYPVRASLALLTFRQLSAVWGQATTSLRGIVSDTQGGAIDSANVNFTKRSDWI